MTGRRPAISGGQYQRSRGFCAKKARHPEDFVARLAALLPKPRAHLTRYHGVFAPASPYRAKIVSSARAVAERSEAAVIDWQQGMSWAQRLKRVFVIDIETCRQCGDRLRVTAPAHPCAPRN